MKNYRVEIRYEDPYLKNCVEIVSGSSHGRAVNEAYKKFKKTRPRKREPVLLRIVSSRL